MKKRIILYCFIFFLCPSFLWAQKANRKSDLKNDSLNVVVIDTSAIDTIQKRKPLSKESKIAISSAIIPGLGQIKNKKFWKVPIIYILGGAATGTFIYTNKVHTDFKSVYLYYYNNEDVDVNYTSPYTGLSYSNINQIEVERDRFRTTRDYAVIGMMAIYALNIFDAYVDAHLATFDVSPDLSLQINPYNTYFNKSTYNGFTLNIVFK